MKRRVVITGMGAITPVGLSAKETWTNVRNGVVGIAPIEALDTEERQVKVAGEVKASIRRKSWTKWKPDGVLVLPSSPSKRRWRLLSKAVWIWRRRMPFASV